MDTLERVTVVLTLMRRLGQVMDREIAVLRGLKLAALADVQQEKAVLAEAYEIEMRRLRSEPELLARLDPAVCTELFAAMRDFQGRLRANRLALEAARQIAERVLSAVHDGLANTSAVRGDGGTSLVEPRGQVIALARDRET